LPLFVKLLLLDTKLSLIIHCNTCDALFIYNVLYRLRLKVLDPVLGSGSKLFEPRLRLGVFELMDNIINRVWFVITSD